MKKITFLFAAFLASHVCALAASPAVEAILAKARARLGGDRALDRITSIHYSGTIEQMEDAPDAKPAVSSIDILFQKPAQHRLTVSSDKSVDVTALDGYSAWRRTQEPDGLKRVRLMALDKEQLKRLRANTWENLYFYRGIAEHGGEIVDRGPVEVDGLKCHKIAFNYGPGIEFVRIFEIETGRLVLTETLPVGTIREEGEMIVEGVRFPKKLVAAATTPSTGKKRVVTINFDRIVLNEAIPASSFEQPMPGR